MDVPTDFVDNATTSATAHYLHAIDPLVLEMCVSAGHHEWDDPMLEELVASLVVSQPVGAPTPRCLPATVTASPAMLPLGDSPTSWRPWRAQTTATSPQAWVWPPLPGHRKGDSPTSWMPRHARKPYLPTRPPLPGKLNVGAPSPSRS